MAMVWVLEAQQQQGQGQEEEVAGEGLVLCEGRLAAAMCVHTQTI